MKLNLIATAASVLLAAVPLAARADNPPPQPLPLPPATEAPKDIPYPGVLKVQVDATDVERRIFRVRETIPVAQPGPMTVLYPQWAPGGHSPRNPIYFLAGVVFRANGQVIPWKRDPVDMFAFHLEPPAGVAAVEVEYQVLGGDQNRTIMTPEILNAQWIGLTMYPAGYFARQIPVDAAITVPDGWTVATALETASREGALTRFQRVPFETLADSPIFAGRHFRSWDLDTSGKSPVRLNVVADRPELLDAKPEQIEAHRELIRQADRLYGARHFNHYDFLVALSDRLTGIGLEHHRSSEDGTDPEYFTNWEGSASRRTLLPHEYSHSWNGKFRRPADLWTPNYNVPMRNSLLWVYEGQDQYWGFVLGARSGLLTHEQALDALAITAAGYSQGRPGRQWRSVEDTTADPPIAMRRTIPWPSWQRSEDYYSEGQLVWLDVDTLIRERTGGRRSLDDFARAFFGVNDGSWTPLTYTFDDVVRTLNAVTPYDWADFLNRRIKDVAPQAPLEGITRGGYELVYTDRPTAFWRDSEAARKTVDLTYSIGVTLNRDGALTSVLWDGPAFRAGFKTGDRVVAVNGLAYDSERLRTAIAAAKTSREPITLIMRDADRFRVVPLDYHDGLRYPRLQRVAGRPDLLSEIYRPLK